jgi:hypothetical protein
MTAAEALIREAALSPIAQIPAMLSSAVSVLEKVKAGIQTSSPPDRELIIARLKSFQTRLLSFSSVMRRSEAIFQGYARGAGVSVNEYGPAGESTGTRDPAFFSLTV